MSKKISTIELKRFRGIPKTLKLDFLTKNTGEPSSCIIFGDNGTGKSSIVDGIEFALQARIDRVQNLKSELKPSPISLNNFDTAEVKVKFQDDTNIERNINIETQVEGYKLKFDNSRTHPNFGIAPIVLRRSDILKFIQTPSHQKQILFFSYIKSLNDENWTDDFKEETKEFNSERTVLKNVRRDLVEKLSLKMKIASEDIPLKSLDFDLFISEKIYNGINKKERDQLSRRGFKLQVNERALEIAKEIKKVNDEINLLNKSQPKNKDTVNIRETTQKKLSEIFSDAGNYLTESFKSISSSNFFDRIEMRIGDLTDVSLDVIVHLKNGKEIKPNNIFSEANLDLMALLIFLSIVKEASENGQEKVLILDDVLQSVDSTIRLMFVDFLLKNFSDWQLIFSIHDRLFLNQLKTIFKRHSHNFVEIEILKWDFLNGPFILKKDTEADNSLTRAILTSDVNLIASQAGVFLEKICNHLSYSLPISVVRRREDKYTLGDLWPGVFKKLKRTELSAVLEIIDQLSFLRNLLGAHYNEWALSLSNSETLRYADSVKSLYESVFCSTCLTWVGSSSNNSWCCACGKCSLTTK